ALAQTRKLWRFFMKYAIFSGVVSLGLLVSGAQAQEGSHNDVTVSATGVFQKSTTGNGITQTATQEPGVLRRTATFSPTIKGLNSIMGSPDSTSSTQAR